MLSGRVVVFAVVALSLASCTKPNPLDCSDGTCSDKAHPYCDKDGTVDGSPNTCIAVSCSAPNAFVECKGNTAVSCNAAGDGYDLMQCTMGCSADAQGCNMCTPNGTYCTATGVQSCGADGAPTTFEACAEGCSADPQPHCNHLVPRYLPNVCDTAATSDFDVPMSASLGTDLDTACSGGIVMQTAAPNICVVRGKNITIASGATFKVTGGRLLALVADDSLAIHGVLDASADGATSGPGGGAQTSGGARQSQRGNGGGGAGFQTAGGPGASNTTDGGAANGGAAQPDPAQLAVMVGGPKNDGGAGGGVILVACRGTVAVDGVIDIGGGGGEDGTMQGTFYLNGGGGGAGGYLVLQAWSVSITGKVYANGGGGGGGIPTTGSGRGEDGPWSSTVCAAGGVPGGSSGAGGNGACGTTGAGAGAHGTAGSFGNAGGGGGGLGYLQTYTPMGVPPTITPTDASPGFQPNLNVQTQ